MPWQNDTMPGSVIVKVNVVATAVFTVSALAAAILFTAPWRVQGVVVSLALFSVGVCVFLWGYWSAVQRSRVDQIAVAQIYFLTHGVVPRPQRLAMWLALAVQSIVSLATALARPDTDGKPGSTLAFGILVPMLGLGLNGLLAARHGRFAPRPATTSPVPPTDPEMEQNAHHG
jgi:hypothetical protein